MSDVGQFRQRMALTDAKTRVVLVTSNPALESIVRNLRVVHCFPDTTDEHGNWDPTFKIEVAGPKGAP